MTVPSQDSGPFTHKWELSSRTTPSGKVLYECQTCGIEDPAPVKAEFETRPCVFELRELRASLTEVEARAGKMRAMLVSAESALNECGRLIKSQLLHSVRPSDRRQHSIEAADKARIRVAFSELRSTGYYSNVKAEASIEMDSEDLDRDFPRLWDKVRTEVRGQLERPLEEPKAGKPYDPCSGYQGPDEYPDEGDDDAGEVEHCEEPQECREPDPYSGDDETGDDD